MPNIVTDLIVDRVDLVEEGANSAAFIELYKRRESKPDMTLEEILEQMKQEHAAVIKAKIAESDTAVSTLQTDLAKAKEELQTATDDLAKAKEELDKAKACKECGEPLNEEGKCPKGCGTEKSGTGFDETEVVKSASPELASYIATLKSKKDAAEEEIRKANEAKAEAEAIAKAASLKSLPIEQEKLVGILKGATPDLVDILTSINSAIDTTVLDEVGKSTKGNVATDSNVAWSKIETAADTIAKNAGITKQAAIAQVIKEQPQLYKDYLNGGAN